MKRNQPVFFRLWISTEEKEALGKGAKLRNQSMSAFIRQAMNKELAKLGVYSDEKRNAFLTS